MDRLILTAILLLTPIAVISAQEPVPEMKEIPAGYYWMGSSGWGHFVSVFNAKYGRSGNILGLYL